MSRQFNRIPSLAALFAIAAATTAVSGGDLSLPSSGPCWDIFNQSWFTDIQCTVGYSCGEFGDMMVPGTTWETLQSTNPRTVICDVYHVIKIPSGQCVLDYYAGTWEFRVLVDLEGLVLCDVAIGVTE